MVSQNTISRIMRKHHSQIEGLLKKFKKSKNNMLIFNRFKWELEKHFFVEEKAIFTYIYSEDQASNEMKSELLDEHNMILEQLNEIESRLMNNENAEFSKFHGFLTKHKKFEDEIFYPKLDEELGEAKKKEILDRISNPV